MFWNCTELSGHQLFQSNVGQWLQNTISSFNLMFIPCTIRCSRNNQQYALICTTPLFSMLAPTCFSSSLPSLRSFLDYSELLEIHIEWVVYLKCITDKRISMYNVLCRIKQIEWHNNNRIYNELKYGKNVLYKKYVHTCILLVISTTISSCFEEML
jgi:hypothetical protein